MEDRSFSRNPQQVPHRAWGPVRNDRDLEWGGLALRRLLPRGLKPGSFSDRSRGAEAPLFHGAACGGCAPSVQEQSQRQRTGASALREQSQRQWPTQVRFWLVWGRSHVTDLVPANKLDCPHGFGTYAFSAITIPRLRSGFRQRAQMPARRLNFLLLPPSSYRDGKPQRLKAASCFGCLTARVEPVPFPI